VRPLSTWLLAAFLTGCVPVLKGGADLQLRELLAKPGAGAEAIIPLLSPEVVVHRNRETVKGIEAGAAALAELKLEQVPEVLRHHDVTLVLFGDGRTLLLERGADDRIVKAIEIPQPLPPDQMSQKFVYWGAAWNTNLSAPRLALVQAAYAEGTRYVDPGHDVYGTQDIAQMIGNLRTIFPGSVIHYTSAVTDAGGGWLTEDWVMLSRLGGRVLFRGMDVLHLDAEGKIDYLAGFIGVRTPR
jgi:hypothetical protein